VGENVLDEMNGDLDENLVPVFQEGAGRVTMAVPVVDETNVMFMSCSIRLFGYPSRFRTRLSKIECCSRFSNKNFHLLRLEMTNRYFFCDI
jgi:hypothetical protein